MFVFTINVMYFILLFLRVLVAIFDLLYGAFVLFRLQLIFVIVTFLIYFYVQNLFTTFSNNSAQFKIIITYNCEYKLPDPLILYIPMLPDPLIHNVPPPCI